MGGIDEVKGTVPLELVRRIWLSKGKNVNKEEEKEGKGGRGGEGK